MHQTDEVLKEDFDPKLVVADLVTQILHAGEFGSSSGRPDS